MTDERRIRITPPRLALSPDEAAASLGVSRTLFFEQILPRLRTVRPRAGERGRVLIPVTELQSWLDRNIDEALVP